MAEYLFNFDIHNAGSNVYTKIEELLKKNNYTILDHPLGSTYLIQKNEVDIRSLCGEIGNCIVGLRCGLYLVAIR